jgi:hypothetical protein
MFGRRFSWGGGLALLAGLLLAGCASNDPNRITKVKTYKLDTGSRVISNDVSLVFEQQSRLHGSLTAEDTAAREGYYYTVMWKVADRSQPATLRMEYLRGSTGSKKYVKEVIIEAPRRSNTTELAIVGDEYKDLGQITAWRISLVQGKTILAGEQSYLWE